MDGIHAILAWTSLEYKALMAALWVSLAGPLSWFFIFKGHAYIHPHMDHIVWHFPFMLMAFVLMAIFMKQCIETWFSEKKTSKEFFK